MNTQKQDIYLYDFFILISKYKVFIVVFIFLITLLVSVYNFFYMEKIYQAESIIELSENHRYKNEVDRIFTIRPILQDVINELKLEQRYGINYEGLKESIDVIASGDTSLITISTSHKDPKTAQEITDQLIKSFNRNVEKTLIQEPEAQISYLEKQINDARNKYNEKYQVLQKIKQTGDPLEVLQNDYNSAVTALKPAKQNLSNIMLEYEAAKKIYEQTSLQLTQVNEKFILQKSIDIDTIILYSLIYSSEKESLDLTDLKFNDEIINPLYERLLLQKNTQYQEMISLESEKTVLKEKVLRLEKEIEDLYPKIEEKKKNIEDAVNEMNYAKNDFKRYEDMLNNAQNQIVTRQNDNKITVLSSADLPVNDDNSTFFMIILAFFASFFVSILLVFVFEFYKSYKHYKIEMSYKE